MKPYLALVVLGIFACVSPVQARLGETITQCKARYGPPVEEKLPATVKESDPDVWKFSKDGITALIEFKGGIAWRIVFRMAVMTATDAEALLKANMADGGWGAGMKINGQEFRLSADRRRIAIYSPAIDKKIAPTLEITSRDYGAASYAAYSAKVSEAISKVKDRKVGEGFKGF